jgi:hypothetical protein
MTMHLTMHLKEFRQTSALEIARLPAQSRAAASRDDS